MDIGVSEYGKYLSIYIQLYQSIFRIEIDSTRTNFERVELNFYSKMTQVVYKNFKSVWTWLWRHFQSASSNIHFLKVGLRIWIFELTDRKRRHSQVLTDFVAFIYY